MVKPFANRLTADHPVVVKRLQTGKPMDDDSNLGPVEPWQIKHFPRRLRQELTEQARLEQVNVGELLTRLVLAARDSRWQFNGLAEVKASKPDRREKLLAMTERAIAAAAQLAEAKDVPPDLRMQFETLLSRSLPGVKPRQAVLPAPTQPIQKEGDHGGADAA
jgi:hypothetical protein